ncbi:MAG: hypothetical protein AB8F74_03755 [Saprospiraceae bacterium]
MRYFLFLFFLASGFTASAQIFVNKVDVNSRPVQYVEVWEKFNKDNGKFFAMLDYGQQDDLADKEGKSLYLTNQTGQYLEFNSMVDALNFMYRNGWEVLHVNSAEKIQSYILKQRTNFTRKVIPQTNNTDVSAMEKKVKPVAGTAMEAVKSDPVPEVKVQRVAVDKSNEAPEEKK